MDEFELIDYNTIRNGGFTLRKRRAERSRLQTSNLDDIDGLPNQTRNMSRPPKWFANETIISKLKLWKSDFRLIEGKCGSAVTCYYIFLRRLIMLNLILACISVLLYFLPNFLATKSKQVDKDHVRPNSTKEIEKCNYPPEHEESSGIEQVVLFLFGQGKIHSAPLLYGFYKPNEIEDSLRFCLCYLLGTTLIYVTSLIFLSIITGKSIFKSIVGKSANQMHKYSRLVLSSWDFNISNRESQRLKRYLISNNIKTELVEDRVRNLQKNWARLTKTWIYIVRICTTIANLAILILSVYVVALAVTKGKKLRQDEHITNWFLKLIVSYLVSIALAGTAIIAPAIFQRLIQLQKLRFESATNQLLAWRVALRFLSILTLFITLFVETHHCSGIKLKTQGHEDDGSFTDIGETCDCKNPLYVCWADEFGQEMYKLVIGWLFGQLANIMAASFFKQIRVCTKLDLPFFQTFDLTSNVLKVVSWQTVCWMGCFYSPMLPLIVLVIQIFVFHLNRWACLSTYTKNEDQLYKSKSEAFFFTVLLLIGFYVAFMLNLYVILILKPPSSCGPFMGYKYFTEPYDNFVGDFSNPWIVRKFCYFFQSKRVGYTVIILLFACTYYFSIENRHWANIIDFLEIQLMKDQKDKQLILIHRKTNVKENPNPTSLLRSIKRTLRERNMGSRNSSARSSLRNSANISADEEFTYHSSRPGSFVQSQPSEKDPLVTKPGRPHPIWI